MPDTTTFSFQRIAYDDLNSRQQENFNFQKISARLADFGFTTIRLSDDWNGADFLALHLHGETLKVQLKGRATFMKKYEGKRQPVVEDGGPLLLNQVPALPSQAAG